MSDSDTGMTRKAGEYLGDIYVNMGIIATSVPYDAQEIEPLKTWNFSIIQLLSRAKGHAEFEMIEASFRELRDDTENYVRAIGNADTVGELLS